jgi:XisH protein
LAQPLREETTNGERNLNVEQLTHDPLPLKIGTLKLEVDLGAEKLIGVQKDNQKIVEFMTAFSTLTSRMVKSGFKKITQILKLTKI